MSEHISFEDLTAFVWLDTLTAEKRALSLRVNQHLLACDECYAIFQRLQSVRTAARELARRKAAGARMEQFARENLRWEQTAQEQECSTVYAAASPQLEILDSGVIPLP